jgi:AGZA family xanthine/uracil permease-like MFS transporter
MLPALAYLITVPLKALLGPQPPGSELLQTLRCLSGGFILTSLIWAAALALILDDKLRSAALYFVVAGLLTLVGIMHSPLPDEKIDLPHNVLAAVPPEFQEAVRYQTPYHWAGAYALMALLLLGLAALPRVHGQDNGQDHADSLGELPEATRPGEQTEVRGQRSEVNQMPF